MKVGDKIKFKSEKQRYTVSACDERFIIAWKPFNARKTFIYTIVDLRDNQRSSDNYYCAFDYSNKDEAKEALDILNKTAQDKDRGIYHHGNDFDGKFRGLWLSGRRNIELDIERIDSN